MLGLPWVQQKLPTPRDRPAGFIWPELCLETFEFMAALESKSFHLTLCPPAWLGHKQLELVNSYPQSHVRALLLAGSIMLRTHFQGFQPDLVRGHEHLEDAADFWAGVCNFQGSHHRIYPSTGVCTLIAQMGPPVHRDEPFLLPSVANSSRSRPSGPLKDNILALLRHLPHWPTPFHSPFARSPNFTNSLAPTYSCCWQGI